MKRENRYFVIKNDDALLALDRSDCHHFNYIMDKVRDFRAKRGAAPLECVVIESDWPEYEHVWELIRLRVEKAQIPAETVQGVVDAPAVDAALRSFTDDATNDNAFFLVRAIMEACLPRASE